MLKYWVGPKSLVGIFCHVVWKTRLKFLANSIIRTVMIGFKAQRKKRWIQETSIPPRYQLGNGIYHFHCSLAGCAGAHSWVLKKSELIQGNKKQSPQKYHNPKIWTPAQLPSHVWLSAAPWIIAHQAPLPMEFSRQEYWSGVTFPPPVDLPNSGIKPMSLASSALDSWPLAPTGKSHIHIRRHKIYIFQQYLSAPLISSEWVNTRIYFLF